MCTLQQQKQQQMNRSVSGDVNDEGGDVVTDDDLNIIIRNIVIAGILPHFVLACQLTNVTNVSNM